MMKSGLAACVLMFSLCAHGAWAQVLSKQAAVELAEKFVTENGYTDAPSNAVKRTLDPESIEWTSVHAEMLKFRFNTLKPKAIGIRKGRRGTTDGWSVSFDYVATSQPDANVCRVVTMKEDGSLLRIEHVDGIRSRFVGFN